MSAAAGSGGEEDEVSVAEETEARETMRIDEEGGPGRAL
jgi:hypothetical protein